MVIQIQLFGPLKRFGKEGVVEVAASPEQSIGEIRETLKQALRLEHPCVSVDSLIDSAVFADNSSILTHWEQLGARERLALLPPVCGG